MIRDYKILNIDNNEVLLIDIQLSFSFAKDLNNKDKNKNIIEKIFKYLKDHNIKFNGKKIILITSGLTLGTILLNKNIDVEYKVDNYSYIANVVKEANYFEIDSQIKEEIKTDKYLQVENSTSTKNNTKKSDIKETKTETKTETETKEEIETETKQNITTVTIYRSNGTVLNIELEEYLIGVVAAEMPASFNFEALRAGAIVARTYTLKSIATGRKLTDTVSTQAYNDNNQLKAKWKEEYTKYYNKIKSAIISTKGLYIIYNGEIIEAVYHSTSNGYTENSFNVWGNSFPYLISVSSPWDISASSYLRSEFISYESITQKLGISINKDTVIILKKDKQNRVIEVQIDTISLSGVKFRNTTQIRSTDFELERSVDGILITTRGYGHGVGMSQYGANGMAKEGYKAEAILKHYYQDVIITAMQ